MTGLDDRQLTDLVVRVHARCGGKFVSAGRPVALGLFRSVAMVVTLMRKNVTQDFAGAIFGVSQSTVSRRWDLLRPVIGEVLADVVPDPREVLGGGTVLVDGTVCPTWDWNAVSDLFSVKAGYPGMNLQIAATLDGVLVAVGEVPIHGAPPRRTCLRRIRTGGASARSPVRRRPRLHRRRGHQHGPAQAIPRHRPRPQPSRVQHRPRQNPRSRRTRHRAPQNMAHAQRRRRPIPLPHQQIRKHSCSNRRPLLLCGL